VSIGLVFEGNLLVFNIEDTTSNLAYFKINLTIALFARRKWETPREYQAGWSLFLKKFEKLTPN